MMPKTKNEGIFFTSLMCFLMVLGMSIYRCFYEVVLKGSQQLQV